MKKELDSKIYKYLELVYSKNQVMNITGFKNKEDILNEGIINSLLAFEPLINQIDRNSVYSLLDIGAGPGFPSVPVLIENQNLFKLTIMESQKKRCEFLKNVSEDLNLNFQIINSRAEEYNHNYVFDFITARALSSIKNIFLMSHHLLKKNGYWYLLKGENYQTEIDEFLHFFPEKSNDIEIYKYLTFDNKLSYIVKIKKTKNTPKNWPLKWNNILNYKK
ncbi:16S rRNA (guanine(527)-N(7))-methyltransferase RsmG [Mycoplasmopsis gallinarum]